jgi:hypothetical protein
MTKILITIEGGEVTSVVSNTTELQYIVHNEDEKSLSEILYPDTLSEDGKFYSLYDFTGASAIDKDISQQLFSRKF